MEIKVFFFHFFKSKHQFKPVVEYKTMVVLSVKPKATPTRVWGHKPAKCVFEKLCNQGGTIH